MKFEAWARWQTSSVSQCFCFLCVCECPTATKSVLTCLHPKVCKKNLQSLQQSNLDLFDGGDMEVKEKKGALNEIDKWSKENGRRMWAEKLENQDKKRTFNEDKKEEVKLCCPICTACCSCFDWKLFLHNCTAFWNAQHFEMHSTSESHSKACCFQSYSMLQLHSTFQSQHLSAIPFFQRFNFQAHSHFRFPGFKVYSFPARHFWVAQHLALSPFQKPSLKH